jgi:tRNA threonylcarbamoyladenosine biosynthesis protein TsaB
MPCLLALDTSTERLVVALDVDGAASAVDEDGGARASARIVPVAMELLARAGRAPADLDAVAFGRGPGAFTGLRTACAVAQGLAWGAGCPVLPIDSLLVVAEDARAQLAPGGEPFETWVAMDARMDEVYAAAYAWRGDAWQVLREPALASLEALRSAWRDAPPAAVAGSALDAFGDRLDVAGARRVPVAHDRAAALLRVARRAWGAGDAVDAALALPVYLRDKVALTTAERAQRAGTGS